jgi:hypothetical protein
MNVYLHMRSVIRTSMCAAALVAAAVSSGSAADRQQAQARLLDHAEFLCDNCFFGASDHYYCFAADNQILVAYQRTPVLNWRDKTKNYLTAVHPSWAAWTAPGQTVPISYDGKYIWVARPDGGQDQHGFWAELKGLAFWASRGDTKQVRLNRSSKRDIFTNSETCRDARPKGQ